MKGKLYWYKNKNYKGVQTLFQNVNADILFSFSQFNVDVKLSLVHLDFKIATSSTQGQNQNKLWILAPSKDDCLILKVTIK